MPTSQDELSRTIEDIEQADMQKSINDCLENGPLKIKQIKNNLEKLPLLYKSRPEKMAILTLLNDLEILIESLPDNRIL